MFIDRVEVTFVSGKGGSGCVSFRREKFIPRGGPDGGDGGRGGDVVLKSSKDTASLIDFKFHRIIRAENGGNGMGKKRTGKSGAPAVLLVPEGTVVKTIPDEKLIFDFDRADLELIIARGGKRGKGNTRFKSSVNQAPRQFEKGEKGETIQVILELKLIAYAGLVGLPNAGKSTLISRLSAARPKIADYPFTTLTPHLGVVYHRHQSLVMADIPGIIEGAHRGEGMGLEFLRHIERTRLLIFLIEAVSASGQSPLETLMVLENELREYQPAILKKKTLVAVNKIDLLDAGREGVDELRRSCRARRIPVIEISALLGTGLDRLKRKLFELHEQA